jgi:hypothetical protein
METSLFERGVPNTLLQDLIFPFQQYGHVQSFISRTEGAYLTMALAGFFIQSAGYAPAIAGAVGTMALASSATTVILRILTNTREPIKNSRPLTNAIGISLTILSALMLFAFFQRHAVLSNPVLTLTQFGVGLILTYLGGLTYLRVYSHYCETELHEAIKIVVPAVATFGALVFILLAISTTMNYLGLEQYLQVLKPGSEV